MWILGIAISRVVLNFLWRGRDQSRDSRERGLKLRAISRKFCQPKCVTISDHSRLVIIIACVYAENGYLIAWRKLGQLVHDRGAHFVTLQKPRGAVITQIENEHQRQRLTRLAFAIE